MVWWRTSIYNRQQDLQNALNQKGKKFTKLETAYSDWNYLLGRAKCQNCVFFQGNGQCSFTEGQAEDGLPIRPSGLCHAITTNPPANIEYYYNKIPPNGTTAIYIGAYFGYIYLIKKKGKKEAY